MTTTDNVWPTLAYAEWADTCNTLHLWTQVVGKVKLALAPLVNHWWGVVLLVSARGLTTGAMPYRDRALQIDFDFCAHELIFRTSDSREQRIALRPMTTADFYTAVMAALRALEVDVRIWTMPGEIEGAIPFEQDRIHASYDGAAVQTFWRQLVQADRVFNIFRARYLGKVSPVHFFWGSFDLAVTRFSGRAAPPLQGSKTPNVAPWVMQEAYSHECASLGFWPGNGGYGRAAFYAYAYPEPDGFGAAKVAPPGAGYNADVGQFLIDYDAVRTAAAPDAALLAFAQSTYEAAAIRGNWDRKALERQ
ncbi:MAG: hypothetical protein E6G97_10765 [Alphaproteobacteria bacterium]|nr:MAG: hypothetical protein E6G97_10765 [Alphaproteobacteria bacterium]